ncbi:MAG TPA: sugar transferase [Tepidisphaeraceae bacterium]|nr:sugar transferase [Tepidisphaeraceae bacterium]
MVQDSPAVRPARAELPTVWGLDPVQLHDRFWAARGVCVVRPNDQTPIPQRADLFMLTDDRTLVLFPLRQAVDQLYWVKPEVLFIRLRGRPPKVYRELIRQDASARFLKFERDYGTTAGATARVALTRDRRVAELWQTTDGSGKVWRELRRQTRQIRGQTVRIVGQHYDRGSDHDLDLLVNHLVERWRTPTATIDGPRELRPGVWASGAGGGVEPSVRVVGRAWVGVGREVSGQQTLIGPAVLWDDPSRRPVPSRVRWGQIDSTSAAVAAARVDTGRASSHRRASKRVFDIIFASLVLLATLPLYPLILLAIWIEDGRPFFFGHRRETRGGREFPCLKFRSMRKDADEIRARLGNANQSDGPQFFISNDPRVTRVGCFLRRTNLDELPQFVNVLLGHMSVVGPRPSPRNENQFCPAWREARLSVRPGITGLWQVSRTRRQGFDFQEWIRFDVEYVEKASWLLDAKIILKTCRVMLGV